MSKWKKILQMTFMALICVGLYAFTNYRNKARMVEGVLIKFTPNENVYTNSQAVNKLLIQKNKGPLKQPKEKVALSTIEKWLNEDPMLQNAMVYLTVDGALEALLTQKTPEARVVSDSVFYIDKQGKPMPLSLFYSARVPMVSGDITLLSLKDVHEIVSYSDEDVFLKKNMVGIEVVKEGYYKLIFRMEDFEVVLGSVQNLEKKTKKLQAFYNKATKDNSLQDYSLVDLRFENQVVATKK